MTDLELAAGDAVLNIDTLGGGLRALRVGGWQILDGYDEGTPLSGRRGHVLMPWPNRILHGRYEWGGNEHTLPVTDVKNESASHGLVDGIEWEVVTTEPTAAMLTVQVPPTEGYPFEVSVAVRYVLEPNRLSVTLGGTNRGDGPAPFGAGMHPYFRTDPIVDATEVSLPVDGQLPLDGQGAPSGPVSPFDGEVGAVGERSYDTALRRDPTQDTAVMTGAYGTLRLVLDDSWRWLMLFTGDKLPDRPRGGLAVEPMTCPPGAFASGTDVLTLEAGASWTGTWSLEWAPS